jgi:hypothetical protein
MSFDECIVFLATETGVCEKLVRRSLTTNHVLKHMNPKKGTFEITPADPKLFIDQCGKKVPLTLAHIRVRVGIVEKDVTVYSHKYWVSGYPKMSLTTAPKMEPKCARYPSRANYAA